MKKLHQYLTILTTAALAACSSMDVSDDEALAENFPSDFNVAVYASLHPALHSLEIRDYVAAYNAHLKDSLGADAYAEMETAENLEFIGNDSNVGDTALLHVIFVDKQLVGYSEQKWNDIWLTTTITQKDTIWSDSILVSCKLNPKAEDAESKDPIEIVVVDSVKKDDKGSYTFIFGKTDPEAESKAYELSESTYEIRKGSLKQKAEILDTKEETIEMPGRFTSKDITNAKAFNMIGVPKDVLYQKLLDITMDEFAISYQYVVFGKSHGWAYRPCKEEEKMHPIQTEVYPMKKYYCDDDGIAREI